MWASGSIVARCSEHSVMFGFARLLSSMSPRILIICGQTFGCLQRLRLGNISNARVRLHMLRGHAHTDIKGFGTSHTRTAYFVDQQRKTRAKVLSDDRCTLEPVKAPCQGNIVMYSSSTPPSIDYRGLSNIFNVHLQYRVNCLYEVGWHLTIPKPIIIMLGLLLGLYTT
ncbi:hypothetical protein GOBAR_DD18078 [Gossypium barbadense]|nr:hypothetical protein GOBAR_DD18078 [Gossypium barbadense]